MSDEEIQEHLEIDERLEVQEHLASKIIIALSEISALLEALTDEVMKDATEDKIIAFEKKVKQNKSSFLKALSNQDEDSK